MYSNPQDALPARSDNDSASQQSNKRSREGNPIPPNYANVVSNQPPQASNVLDQLANNQKTLDDLHSRNSTADETLRNIDITLTNINSTIGTHDLAIVQLTNTQKSQGELIQKISDRQETLQGHMSAICSHLNVNPPEPPIPEQNDNDVEMSSPEASTQSNTNDQNEQASNTSQGAPEGRAP